MSAADDERVPANLGALFAEMLDVLQPCDDEEKTRLLAAAAVFFGVDVFVQQRTSK